MLFQQLCSSAELSSPSPMLSPSCSSQEGECEAVSLEAAAIAGGGLGGACVVRAVVAAPTRSWRRMREKKWGRSIRRSGTPARTNGTGKWLRGLQQAGGHRSPHPTSGGPRTQEGTAPVTVWCDPMRPWGSSACAQKWWCLVSGCGWASRPSTGCVMEWGGQQDGAVDSGGHVGSHVQNSSSLHAAATWTGSGGLCPPCRFGIRGLQRGFWNWRLSFTW